MSTVTPATTTVNPDSLPTVDLCHLSLSDLHSLSKCSNSSFGCYDVVIPKIDRSIFNESAGSRKQTYSRLRLALANSSTIHCRTPRRRTLASDVVDDPEQAENSQISSLLSELFQSNAEGLAPIEAENDVVLFQSNAEGPRNVFHGPSIGTLRHYDGVPPYHTRHEEPFSLVTPNIRTNLVFDRWRNLCFDRKVLAPGMVLFKNYLTLKGQVDIVNICQKGAMGPGGFYQPTNQNGDKLRLHMMCFGRNWDPVTKYEKRYRSDGSEPPPLPYEFISLAENTIRDAQWCQDKLPSMCPQICVANFYSIYGRIGLHQDCDEGSRSLIKGLPVISVSIGSSAEFFYGDCKDADELDTVLLESGDVLVFGGESRHIFHGVRKIVQDTAPDQLLQETGLIPGRLNLTLRQVA
ncbi:DNA N(6)-methyladenine demethylase ALKBH1C-like [Bidens hawaiensis]|uniref:DNA N(6)-methyladenine demethylase ALKBH1C-like n=1 Tax=Bidens hawaiensis TaxID=980011 RepID=UPI0040491C2C